MPCPARPGIRRVLRAFAREITDPVLPQQVAGGAAAAHRAPDLHLVPRREAAPLPQRALVRREVDRNCSRPFTRACSLRIEREPLRLDPMGAPTTIERQFLMLLVLQLADPGNLAPQATRMDRRAPGGVVPAAAVDVEANVGDQLLRGPCRQRRVCVVGR